MKIFSDTQRTQLPADYQRIRAAMGVPADYEISEVDLAMALRHEARTGELPEFTGRPRD